MKYLFAPKHTKWVESPIKNSPLNKYYQYFKGTIPEESGSVWSERVLRPEYQAKMTPELEKERWSIRETDTKAICEFYDKL